MSEELTTASPEKGLSHNPFAGMRHGSNVNQGTAQIEEARAIAQQQSAYIIAQARPRDEAQSYARLMEACQRKGLASEAIYAFPRGGENISGPSIRLAEEIARCWGNIDYGIVELSQAPGQSEMMAYAIDLQTNTRRSTTFVAKHERRLKNGTTTLLTDPRDVYEINANMGARRLRAMLLSIVPADVVDDAVAMCQKTLAGDNSTPLVDRIKKMIVAFGQLGVNADRLEKKLGRPLVEMTAAEFTEWSAIYRSVKEGVVSAEDFFTVGDASPNEAKKEKTAAEKLAADPAKTATEPKAKAEPKTKAADKLAAKDEPAAEPKKEPAVAAEPAKEEGGDDDNPLGGGGDEWED